MGFFKELQEVVPFFRAYPSWAKMVIVTWICLTALTIAVLIFGRATTAQSPSDQLAAAATNVADQGVWLTIKRVIGYGDVRHVRVTAHVNGNTYIYPSIGNVEWMEVGPDMGSQTFRMPDRERYEVRFSMDSVSSTGAGGTHISQKVDYIKRHPLPISGRYSLYKVGDARRSSVISAEIEYDVTDSPR